jgi:hypothetical protein
MKRNKLGIVIDTSDYDYYLEGHSIAKYKSDDSDLDRFVYSRAFKNITHVLFGFRIIKELK